MENGFRRNATVQAGEPQRDVEELARRLELALRGAPRNTSRDLRDELEEISGHLREIASSLRLESDRRSFDPQPAGLPLERVQPGAEPATGRGEMAPLVRGMAMGAATAIGWRLLRNAHRARGSRADRT